MNSEELGQGHECFGRIGVHVEGGVQAVILAQNHDPKDGHQRDDDHQGRASFFVGAVVQHGVERGHGCDDCVDCRDQAKEGGHDERGSDGQRRGRHCSRRGEANSDHCQSKSGEKLCEGVMRRDVEQPAFGQYATQEVPDHAQSEDARQEERDESGGEEILNDAPQLRNENQADNEHRVDRHSHREWHSEQLGFAVRVA